MNPDTTLHGDVMHGIRVGVWRLVSDEDIPDENDLSLQSCPCCGGLYVCSRETDWMQCGC